MGGCSWARRSCLCHCHMLVISTVGRTAREPRGCSSPRWGGDDQSSCVRHVPWSPSPQPPSLVSFYCLVPPCLGARQGQECCKEGSHTALGITCLRRELSSQGTNALTFSLQGGSTQHPPCPRDSRGRGDLALFLITAASKHLTAGQGGPPGAPDLLPARIPHPAEHVQVCSQHSINSLWSFFLDPQFSVWKSCSSFVHRGIHPATPVPIRRNVHPAIT